MNSEQIYRQIAKNVLDDYQDVIEGKMMSSDGLKVNNKVFAFLHKEEMGFRLGPKFEPELFGLLNAKPLSPFKTKAPLKGWFMINLSEAKKWPELTEMALEFTRLL